MLHLKDIKVVQKIGIVIAAFALLLVSITGLALYSLVTNGAIVENVIGDQVRSLTLAGTASEKKTRMHQDAYGLVIETDRADVPAIQKSFEQELSDLRQSLGELRPLMDERDLRFFNQITADLDAYARLEPTLYKHKIENRLREAEALVQGEMTDLFNKIDGNFDKLIAKQLADVRSARADIGATVSSTLRLTLATGIFGLLLVAGGAIYLVRSQITGPLARLQLTMARISSGDLALEIEGTQRRDELGAMARDLQAFRQAAADKIRLESEARAVRDRSDVERAANDETRATASRAQVAVVSALAEGLQELSHGNLTFRLNKPFTEDYESLRRDFNSAIERLQSTMQSIAVNVTAINGGSEDIARSADEMSQRTERQAASLEESSAALTEITGTVQRTAQDAASALKVVEAAKSSAEKSATIVNGAVEAMGSIETSAREISQIINVMDEIAFQTNLLALNAGVEAARAGEAGKGFAVVASEVRALAQRSAEAAKQIKDLIMKSTHGVDDGVRMVGLAGTALQEIAGQVVSVAQIVRTISASSHEQSAGLIQVSEAVPDMDAMTQQNAAMVEEATAASHSMAREAQELSRLVGHFQLAAEAMAAQGNRSYEAQRPIRRVANAR